MALMSYQRVFLFLILVLLLTSLISPWISNLWDWIRSLNPSWEEYRYPFSRIFNRVFMILAIGLFIPCRRMLGIGSAGQFGLGPIRRKYPDLIKGFSLALASMIAFAAVMTLAGVFTPYFRLPFEVGLERTLKGLLTAVTVGFLEEIFFRGILFKGMLDDWKPAGAFVFANLFYSAVHFVKPAQKVPLEGIDPLAGIFHLIHTFDRFLDPVALLPGLTGLFILGLVLSYAFMRSGSLYLSIGLHAGWIFSIKTLRVFGDFRREDLGWPFGFSDPKIISGWVTWICLIGVGVAVYYLTRKRQGLQKKT